MTIASTAMRMADSQAEPAVPPARPRAAEARATAPVVELRGIRKAFPGTVALAGVSFDVREGEIHALVGENGAGKSTLVSILAGLQAPDDGDILIDGAAARLHSPHDADAHGIALVHQELSLVPEMSVSENVFLGHPAHARFSWLVDARAMDRRAEELLDRFSLRLPVRARVAKLSTAQAQLVEICKGLARQPRVLVLDEPTSSLSLRETEELFGLLRRLRRHGTSIVYISHKLDEVLELADRITVLRDGRTVAGAPIGEWTEPKLVKAMVGRDVSQLYSRTHRPRSRVVLELSGLSSAGRFSDVDLKVHAGEIVGVAGLVGAGRSELAESLFGLDDTPVHGTVWIEGREMAIGSPAEAIAHGLALVPEDRRHKGFVGVLTTERNVSLPRLREFTRGPVVRERAERGAVTTIAEQVGLRRATLRKETQMLSGGNQQKAVIAKWLLGRPKVLILDEPTRGIDVGAKAEIYALIDRLADAGLAVLLISSELPEVMGMSDRILVMRAGRIVADVPAATATEVGLMTAASGAQPERRA